MDETFDTPPPLPPAGPAAEPDDEAGRTGPAWELPGPWFRRFAETAQAALTTPTTFFRTMRRTGGVGSPIAFGIIGTFIGGLAAAIYQALLGTFAAGMQGPQAAREQAFISLLTTGCVVVVMPVMTVVSLFVSAAINHVMLLLLSGARRGFETTMRVASYAHGSSGVINLIPICGGFVSAVWVIVMLIIGLAQAHEISTGKAAAAVLLPIVLCCVLIAFFWAAIVAVIVGGAMAAGSHR